LPIYRSRHGQDYDKAQPIAIGLVAEDVAVAAPTATKNPGPLAQTGIESM
jgi:hypothetical protein